MDSIFNAIAQVLVDRHIARNPSLYDLLVPTMAMLLGSGSISTVRHKLIDKVPGAQKFIWQLCGTEEKQLALCMQPLVVAMKQRIDRVREELRHFLCDAVIDHVVLPYAFART